MVLNTAEKENKLQYMFNKKSELASLYILQNKMVHYKSSVGRRTVGHTSDWKENKALLSEDKRRKKRRNLNTKKITNQV